VYSDVHITAVQGDAADEKTIADLCERAMKEHGRLDVFFANVSCRSIAVDVLANGKAGRHCYHEHSRVRQCG
jgi:NAD(P)-dependent dehydrogenase (short-subunit alcohol dehydrogenase family)